MPAALAALQREAWDGIEAHMIGKAGIPYDRVRCDGAGAVVSNANTSPTNIGLYLAAVVAERDQGAVSDGAAHEKVTRALDTLAQLDKDAHGFLYNWYDADSRAVAAGDRFVSSVDNGNLIVALDGVRHAFRDSPDVCTAIEVLVAPMKQNFAAAFLDGGAVRLGYTERDGVVTPTPHRYDRFGSEARAAVALLEAEGFLPAGTLARMARSTASVTLLDGRTVHVPKTWDGGVFQWLLPQLLLGESAVSSAMDRAHHDLVDALFALGSFGLPAARSASDVPGPGGARYEGKSGVKALAEDAAFVQESALTPHAIFLIASVDRSAADAALRRLVAVAPQIVRRGIGLCDGVDLETGAVTDTLLSLNQLMSVLAGSGFDAHVRARVDELAPGSLAAVYADALA